MTVLFENEWGKAKDKVRKNLKLLRFMGWTVAASRRLFIVC